MNNEIIFRKVIEKIIPKPQSTDDDYQPRLFSYNNLVSTYNNNITIYIFIIVIIFFSIGKYNITLNTIVSFILSYIVLYYILSRNDYLNTKYNNITDLKLDFLNNIMFDKNIEEQSYLYINPVIIQFYFNTKDVIKYNLSNYRSSLLNVNEMIKLEKDMNNLINPFDTFINIRNLYKKAMNNYQSIIYSIPYNREVYLKFNNSLNMLQSLLLKIVDNAKEVCQYVNAKETTTNTIPDSILANEADIEKNDINTIDYNNHFNIY